ncbi:MAG: phage major capsid protein [Armatimonadetes bacterium]|nr:phage major capsid protein [Armatimonadota bacterium]
MSLTQELKAQYDQKKGELNEFVVQHTDPESGKPKFSVAELKMFNDRNDELAPLFDAWSAAVKNEQREAEMKSVDRSGLFGGSGDGAQAREIKSLGDLVLGSEEYNAHKSDTSSGGQGNKFAVEIKGVTLNDLRYANQFVGMTDSEIKATITSGLGVVPYPQQRPGVVEFATRRPVVADLIPQSNTDSPMILYVEETAVTRAAGPVAEGAIKPQSDFTMTRRTVNVEVIAHRFKLTNQALEDIPGLRDRLNQNGTLGLALAEEAQILSGTGVTPELQGFLTKTGVQTQAIGLDDRFTAFRKAMTNVESIGFANTTGGVFNAFDWQEYLTTKDANGRFIFGDPGAQTQETRLWGVPVIGTVAMAQGTALLGDFQMYSRLWRKGGVRVINGWSGDDIDRNLQTIVIEERVALEIDRATAFCKITGLTLS